MIEPREHVAQFADAEEAGEHSSCELCWEWDTPALYAFTLATPSGLRLVDVCAGHLEVTAPELVPASRALDPEQAALELDIECAGWAARMREN